MAFVHSSNTSLYGSPLPPDLDMGHHEGDRDPGDDMYDAPPPPPSSPPPPSPPSQRASSPPPSPGGEGVCSPLSALSAMSALLDLFPSEDAACARGGSARHFECPFGGLGVFHAKAQAGEPPEKKRRLEDSLDRLAIEEVRRATSDSFSFATRCPEMQFEPAPAGFVRIFIVAFLISRFGDQGADMCRVRKHVLSAELACFFGLAAGDECVGQRCEQVVAGVGAAWPRSVYGAGAVHGGLQVPVHVMHGALAGVSLDEQFAQGHATPLLYCSSPTSRSAPFFRAMALQLLIAGGDKALPHKGYRFGSAPWGARVLNPLLQTQVLCLHPHLRLYAALVTYVPEVCACVPAVFGCLPACVIAHYPRITRTLPHKEFPPSLTASAHRARAGGRCG